MGSWQAAFQWEHGDPLSKPGVRRLVPWLWSSGRDLGRAPRRFNPRRCLASPASRGAEVICAALLARGRAGGAGGWRGRVGADLGSG